MAGQAMRTIWRTGLVMLLATTPAEATAQTIFSNGFEGAAAVPSPGLGTNLEGVEDFSSVYPFTDFFKQSRPWVSGAQPGCTPPATPGASCFDTLQGAQLDLDGDGWVRSLPPCPAAPGAFCMARTVINSSGADYPAGTYLVLFDGSGTLTYSGGASRNAGASTPGRDVVDVVGDSIWILTLESTAPAPNHVRNIRILAPGFDPALAPVPTFHPDFLAELAPYRTLRFMDWGRTNGGGFGGAPNPQVEFADRALLSDAHWTREAGVPLEAMIELANVSGTEPWFTIPHQASAAYVTAFAQVVLAQLEAGRRVYVEHSNEVWNNFPQRFDVENDAEGNFPGGAASSFTKRMNQHGLRTRRICDAFRQVFGAQSERITCALGAQAANTFTGEEAAACPLAVAAGLVTGSCLQPGDAYAIAPYFGNYLDGRENADEVAGWTLDDLFDEIESGAQLLDDNANGNSPEPPDGDDVQTPCTRFPPAANVPPCAISALDEVTTWISNYRQSADAGGYRLVAYEGGQHLVGIQGVENNPAVSNLFVAANRDARMGEAYDRYLESWKASGGELFVHFTLSFGYGKFGSWGAIESLQQVPRPPKAAAIDAFNAANPCWWAECEVVARASGE
jgi:hypothetical protein